MSQLFAFRRPLRFIALALCSASVFVFTAPASARPYHGAGRHARAYHAGHHASWHHQHQFRSVVRASRRDRGIAQMQRRGFASTYASVTPDATVSSGFGSSNIVAEAPRGDRRHFRRIARVRHVARVSNWERGVAQMKAGGFADTNASFAPNASVDPNSTLTPPGGAMAQGFTSSPGFVSSNIVMEARRYLGGNPTGRGSLWCARFMNMVLQHSGYRGTGSDMASSFAQYGQRISGPQVGAIAVMTRGRGGGHVGIITGVDAKGNPIMISGNNGNRVREAPVSRGRIYAYVMPAS
jgi:uncharacterized protein (TIGR02594 family)